MFAKKFVIISGIFILYAFVSSTSPLQAQSVNGFASPKPNSIVNNSILVVGRASHPTFRKWQVDLLLNKDEHNAVFLDVGESPMQRNDALIVLDTRHYPDGAHLLRLRVVHSNLNYDEYFLPIVIDNQSSDLAIAEIPNSENLPEGPSSTSSNTSIAEPGDIAQRRIEIDLSEQLLMAWEGSTKILETKVSTGRPEFPTVNGIYRVQRKLDSTRMRGPGYDTPDVPWTMYFFRGYAIHGTYWHNDFGVPISHGCINMPVPDAKRLYDWAKVGTQIEVHE